MFQKEDLVDLNTFVAVAQEGSFTGASVRLETSQSAVSYAIRRLETRLGVRLLNRTTRNVSVTEAGQLLLDTLTESFDEIAERLARITNLGEQPTGTIRITAPEHALEAILWPKLDSFLMAHPAINVEVSVDAGMGDIISGRFDVGVRLAEDLEKDMIAVRIGPDLRKAVVGSPAYFAVHPQPQRPKDLDAHRGINYRRPLTGRILPWEFARRGRKDRVNVGGQLIFNSPRAAVLAAMAGHGLAYVPEHHVEDALQKGDLVRVLEDWCPFFPGFHLYYPSRKQTSAALRLLIEALRHQ